jgi:hypothetical protein
LIPAAPGHATATYGEARRSTAPPPRVTIERTPVKADRDCGDFANQAKAQAFFVAQGGPDLDPHGLDQDGDGVACQSLP